MNDIQRERIAELRNMCYGYTAIAHIVSLSTDSVKAYCRNHGLGGIRAENKATTPSPFCQNCGAEIMQTPGAKKMKFCSKECRQLWWNSHLYLVHQKAVYHFQCLNCGKPFTAYGNSKRKYCTHECYISHRFGGNR